jgi:ubiquinone/menaquinone biosynthesis C-methylase UbiE
MTKDRRVPDPRRDIFNALAAEWDSMCKLKPEQEATLIGLLASLALAKDAAILDVGCGTGVLVPFILPFLGEEGRYTALDVSDEMIARARNKYVDPRISFTAQDIYDFCPDGTSFDTAIVFSAFPHLHDKPAALAAFHRLLKPKGRLCIVHVESSEAINAYHSERVSNEVLKNDYLPTLPEMRGMIDGSRWSIVEAKDREGLYLFILEKRNGMVL